MVLPIWCVMGCDEKGVCYGDGEVGDVYDITVGEPWIDRDAAIPTDPLEPWGEPVPSCERDDVRPGDVFTVRLGKDELNRRACVVPSCSDDFPSESSQYEGDTFVRGLLYVCLNKHRAVQLSARCSAQRLVALARVERFTRSTPMPSGLPDLVMIRGFGVGNESAPSLQCESPEQVFSSTVAAQAGSGGWYCADTFVVSRRTNAR